MLFVACLRSPVLYFATQQSVEKNPEEKGPFLSQYPHLFSFKQMFLWEENFLLYTKQQSLSKMQSAAALQSEHNNNEGLQLPSPAPSTDRAGPCPCTGPWMAEPWHCSHPLCSGSWGCAASGAGSHRGEQQLWHLRATGRGCHPQPAASVP